MTDFVLNQFQNILDNSAESFHKCANYANFLKQPLTLGMFVPCDLDGNVIKEYDWVAPDGVKWEDYEKELLEAKERVLFEGFEIDLNFSDLIMHEKGFGFNINELNRLTIEKISNDNYSLVLTESAKKQIGL